MGIQDILPGREGRAVGKVVSFALFWLCPLDHCGRLEEMNLKMTRTNYNNCGHKILIPPGIMTTNCGFPEL